MVSLLPVNAKWCTAGFCVAPRWLVIAFQIVSFVVFSVIELACGEYGHDKVDLMIKATENGRSLTYFENPESLPSLQSLRGIYYTFKNFKKRLCNQDIWFQKNQMSTTIRIQILTV